MKPYFEEDGIRLFLGDSRELVSIFSAESIITDPVWPNCEHLFPGIDARKVLTDVLEAAKVQRVVIQIGCFSDVRFLAEVPARYPFLRVCWLEYACPSYRGRILNTGDIGYVFGEPPKPVKGRMLMPGKVTARTVDRGFTRWNWDSAKNRKLTGKGRGGISHLSRLPHPTPRRTEHVRWLVKWFGGESVIDPFCGSGTTMLECKKQHVPGIGIDKEERFLEVAAKRLSQKVLNFG